MMWLLVKLDVLIVINHVIDVKWLSVLLESIVLTSVARFVVSGSVESSLQCHSVCATS